MKKIQLLQRQKLTEAKRNLTAQIQVSECQRVLVQCVSTAVVEGHRPLAVAAAKGTWPRQLQAPQRGKVAFKATGQHLTGVSDTSIFRVCSTGQCQLCCKQLLMHNLAQANSAEIIGWTTTGRCTHTHANADDTPEAHKCDLGQLTHDRRGRRALETENKQGRPASPLRLHGGGHQFVQIDLPR